MRKIFSLAVAVALLMASCVKENVSLNGEGGEEVKVTFTTELPISVEVSRAIGDGTAANNVFYAVYEGEELVLSDMQRTTSERYARIELNLFKNVQYDVVFWAQNENAPYVFDAQEKTITYKAGATMTANSEALDAFYGKKSVKIDGPFTTSVKLERPLAQINFGTTSADFAAAETLFNSEITKSSLVVEGATAGFDIFNGVALEGIANLELAKGALVDETITVNNKDFVRLATTYVFADAEGDVVDGLTLSVYSAEGNKSYSMNEIPSVNVKANHRTNIVGRLLTGNGNFEVEVKPGFGDGDINVEFGVKIGDVCYETLAEAYDAAQNGDELVFLNDIKLDEKFIIEKNITLNLGDKTVTTAEVETGKHLYAFEVKAGAEVTIKHGTIKSRGIYNYGNLTLEAGAVIDACDGNGGYAIYNYGTFVMNDGVVKTSYEDDNLVDNGGYDATTIYTSGTATFNGGVVNNISDYTFALDIKSGADVTINGGKFTSIHSTVSNYGNLTINGGEFICNGIEGITAHALVAWNGSTTTITGGTFDGKDNYNGFNVDAVAGSTVYIKGGEFKPVHSGSLYGDGSIVVSGGVFFDKIASSLLAEGCTLEQLQDGNWKVEGKGWYQDANGNYHIEGAKGWLWMADQNDTFFGSKTVYLENDIDFANQEVPVTKMQTPEYKATFDGQGHTVYNVKILANYSGYNQALFDGHMHIKNLTVDGANICGMAQVGVIGANIHGNIENCHVKRARVYAYTHHVGGIVGLHSWYDIKNCSVEDSSIWCFYYGAVGGIAGAKNEVSGKIQDCSVKGCQLIKEGPDGVYPDWDARFGIAVGYAYVPVTVSNITSENNTIKGVASDKLCGE